MTGNALLVLHRRHWRFYCLSGIKYTGLGWLMLIDDVSSNISYRSHISFARHSRARSSHYPHCRLVTEELIDRPYLETVSKDMGGTSLCIFGESVDLKVIVTSHLIQDAFSFSALLHYLYLCTMDNKIYASQLPPAYQQLEMPLPSLPIQLCLSSL